MSDNVARKMPATNTFLNPPGWPQPKGYANGVKARGEMIFVGGMIGWDVNGKLPQGFVGHHWLRVARGGGRWLGDCHLWPGSDCPTAVTQGQDACD